MTHPFLQAALSYPTGLLTALLAVVLLYWLLALIGLVDFESDGLELQADVDASELSGLAAILVGLGLGGVPFSIAASLIVLLAWTFCCLAAMWVLPAEPGLLMQFGAGTGVLLLALAWGVLLTARLIRPLRPLFATHAATANVDLVGQACVVLTGSVDEQVGRAEVKQLGSSLNIRVWALTPNAFKRGSPARITAYDAERARYRIDA
jgi:hypothetical protein